MKKVIILSFLVAGLFACNQEKTTTGSFGEAFTVENTIDIKDLRATLGTQEEMPVQVKGVISKKCKTEGCWLTLHEGNDEEVMVMFKDHAFNIKEVDCIGKEVVINGRAYWKETSVAEQEHLEEDGLEGEEITGVKKELRVEATGITIQ